MGEASLVMKNGMDLCFGGRRRVEKREDGGEIVFCIDFQSWVLGEGECREERGLGFVIVHFEFLIFKVEC